MQLPHQVIDVLLYVPFLAGQLVYVVKRAGFSMRAGRATSRWNYFYLNWDILLFRIILEVVAIYYPIRHFTPNQILGWFHLAWNAEFLNSAVSSPVAILGAGIASDGIFDWLVDWASRSPKVPDFIKKWLSENVQQVPNGNH